MEKILRLTREMVLEIPPGKSREFELPDYAAILSARVTASNCSAISIGRRYEVNASRADNVCRVSCYATGSEKD